MAINERLVHTASAAAAGGGTGNQEEGLILHLDANDVDSYDGDGDVWYDIKDHEHTPSTNVSEHFNTVTFGGNGVAGASTEVTGVGFEPDLVWLKVRNQAYYHRLVDSVRGVDKALRLTATSGEVSSDDYAVLSFNDDGFNYRDYGQANTDIVAWCFKAGGTPSGSDKVSIDGTSYADEAAAGLTAGTLAVDKLSANTKLGFSMVKVIDHNNTKTIAHGLDSAPEMIIQKVFDSSGYNWYVYHKDLGNDKYLNLNTTGAATADNFWDYTNPTGSVFTHRFSSTSFDMIYYCFTSKRGVSKVGAYIGNGSTNNKIYTGFEPAFVMLKNTSISNTRWIIMDNARNPDNPATKVLSPNLNNAEDTSTSYWLLDWERDGFRLKYGADNEFNRSGDTFIYYAVAKNTNETSLIPLKDEFTAGSIETTDLELDLDANSYSGSGDWLDGTSNYNNGTISGANYVNDGNADYFSFDGSDNILLGQLTGFSNYNFSIEMWIRNNGGSSQQYITSFRYPFYVTTMFNGLSGLSGLQIYNGSGSFNVDNTDVQVIGDGKWHHFAATHDGSNLKGYVDGELVDTTATNTTTTFSYGTTNRLGARADLGSSATLNGNIGQLRMYSSALTAAQIKSNYEATRIYNLSSLELHLDAASFDGSTNTPTTWTDSSSNSNNGTITGATFDSELGNWLDFDGSADYIDVPTSGVFDGDFTVEMWWNFDTLSPSGSAYRMLLGGSGYSGSSGLGHYIENNRLRTWVSVNGSASNVLNGSGTDLTTNKWQHIVLTRSGGTYTQYIDTNQVGQGTGTTSSLDSSNSRIGAHYNSASHDIDAKVGQVRLYSNALTQEQIRQNYNFTKPSYPNGYDGDLSGALWNPAGYFQFDGSNDAIDLDTSIGSAFWANNWSASSWVYFDTTTPANQAIFTSHGLAYNYLMTDTNTKLRYSNNNGVDLTTSSGTVSAGQWHHIVITRSSVDGTVIYVDEVSVGTNAGTSNAGTSNTSGAKPTIGGYQSTTNFNYPLDGRVSKFRLYNKALTLEEISALFAEGA